MGRKTDSSGTSAIEEPQAVNVLDGIDLHDPMLQLVKQVLGPFIVHTGACETECCCGLSSAIAEIQRREILVKRYGTAAAG
jgi:hypothetical protein